VVTLLHALIVNVHCTVLDAGETGTLSLPANDQWLSPAAVRGTCSADSSP